MQQSASKGCLPRLFSAGITRGNLGAGLSGSSSTGFQMHLSAAAGLVELTRLESLVVVEAAELLSGAPA